MSPHKNQPQNKVKTMAPFPSNFCRVGGTPVNQIYGPRGGLGPSPPRLPKAAQSLPNVSSPARHGPRTLRLARRPRLLAKLCRSLYLKESSSSREGTVIAIRNPGNARRRYRSRNLSRAVQNSEATVNVYQANFIQFKLRVLHFHWLKRS